MTERQIKVAATVVGLGLGLVTASGYVIAAGKSVTSALAAPARIDKLEEAEVQNKVLRAQVAWTVKVLSERFRVEPPDLSEFQKRERNHARR